VQPLGGAAEVQFLGHGNEVPGLADFHHGIKSPFVLLPLFIRPSPYRISTVYLKHELLETHTPGRIPAAGFGSGIRRTRCTGPAPGAGWLCPGLGHPEDRRLCRDRAA